MRREQVSTAEELLPHVPPAPTKPRKSLFGRQLLSTLKLGILLRIRSPISCIVELLIPIIFIIGSVILSRAIKDGHHKGEDFVSYPATKLALTQQSEVLSSLCYNITMSGEAIAGLKSCAAKGGEVHCFGTAEGLPLDGICIQTNKTPIMFGMMAFRVLSSYGYSLMPVPSFDEIVKMQWMAKCFLGLLGSARLPGSIDHSGWLYVSPRNAYTESLVSHLNETTSLFKYVFARYFDAIDEANEHLHNPKDSVGNWGVIHVESASVDLANPHLNVVIRLNASALPSTSSAVSRVYAGGKTQHASMYLLSGFLTLQKEVYNHFISKKMRLKEVPVPFLALMGTVDYTDRTFLIIAGNMVPLLMVLGFLYPVSQATKRIVLDKELRMKEALLVMGLQQRVQYIAWFILVTAQYVLVSLVCAILLKTTYLSNSNFGVIFFLFFFFSLTTITLSGLIASFFSKSRISSMMAPVIYFLLAAPFFAIGNVSSKVIYVLCLLSPSAFSRGLMLLFNHEISLGFLRKDFNSAFDEPNMFFVFIILIVDLFLYLVIMLYLDAVIPNDWGTPRHPLFCILEPISRLCRRKWECNSDVDGRNPDGVFEPQSEEGLARTTVKIIGLTKKFRRGSEEFLAVNHMHWGLVEGEISVLLGHNGAGKSTTMNMMTGMLKPDGGDCYIYGHSIRKDLRGARQEIGFCPQHNILWPDLTCREHLEYFSSIKGLTGDAQKEAIEAVLNGVDLQEKCNYTSSELSGGQKRKLSVAIAFVGNSRLIFLDEPTAGMDVAARRHMWDLLRKMARSRTILLSTHFMDEADLLGDQITIMSKGSLQCRGSSVFLKANLGVGYNITLSVTSVSNPHEIGVLIRSHVPSAELLRHSAGEMSYRLPMSYVRCFSAMLRDVETLGSRYGVQNYTLSATTLEEIFLHIAHGEGIQANSAVERPQKRQIGTLAEARPKANKDENPAEESLAVDTQIATNSNPPTNTVKENSLQGMTSQFHSSWDTQLFESESKLMLSQLKVSLLKRYLNAIRDRRTQLVQIVFPILMIVVALLLNKVNFINHPSLTLSSDMYNEHVQIDVANCKDTIDTSMPFSKSASLVVHDGIADTKEFSSYLIKSYNTHALNRYTGINCGDPVYKGTTALFANASALHAAAVGMVGFYGAVLHKAIPTLSALHTEDILQVHNFPMLRTKHEDAFRNMMKAVLMSILIMIPFSFIPSTFVSFVVKERECKARHLQNVSGMRFSIYWLSNYIFDLCCYLITMILVIIVMLMFQRDEYISDTTFGPTFILLLMYGLSCIAMSYAVSFLFKEHSSAQNVVLMVNFITGFFLVLLGIILIMLPDTQKAGEGLKWLFRIFPSYCIGEGIVNLASLPGQQGMSDTIISPWSLNVVGFPIIYMALEIPLFILITLFLDHPARRMRTEMMFHRTDTEEELISDEDDDVTMERCRIANENSDASEDLVRVVNLRKVYSNGKVAVRNLSFGVHPGEVFGFLGTNGAGKTTTIAILCQEMVPTSGRAFVCGKDTVENPREALHYIGYCPQFDALLDLLTVEEHLQLYAGIRGVMKCDRKLVVAELMQLFELSTYHKTRAGQLSGGNRRKLSVALALIGGPRAVFLDEPSAGMDPVARRGLWTAIQSIPKSCSVVLTTHHLEEVEALAHRVAIMANGSLRCLGTKTHLKQKYGSGYEVTIRTGETVWQPMVEKFFSRYFPTAALNEVRGNRYTYALPTTMSLSEAFGVLETHGGEICIADYAVSQTSIEQVFLRISEQTEQEAVTSVTPE
ncbi:ABC1 transporter [Trypanosoma rangeli]|uniref:ABC1 transporter n=1 Tax=Trypanosoma rangeli TaxID=5698 RepID=A0A3R7NVN7_TRYRA|nr:ABC1 transporter [Trypanosoma rangeli]RNF12533.1 ABC1 transporter [Trypanosoma rangeli]|eukprot:RNF12533.1 ABC1 transporter [Trypanosoma rangeli]